MKKEINIQKIDFETYLENALKSHGYLFPETDEQMAVFESTMGYTPIPDELSSTDLVFKIERKQKSYKTKKVSVLNAEDEKKWAIAAREGKDISPEVLKQMKKDREAARAKQDENKKA
jgi:hypothetical protein